MTRVIIHRYLGTRSVHLIQSVQVPFVRAAVKTHGPRREIVSDVAFDEAHGMEYIVYFGADGRQHFEGVVGEERSQEETTAGRAIGVGEIVGGAAFGFYGGIDDFVVLDQLSLVFVP